MEGPPAASEPPPPVIWISPLYLTAEIIASSYIVYRSQRLLSKSSSPELFAGSQVRGWFLSILTTGTGLRAFCSLAILLLTSRKPFLLAWLHFIPGLVLLSAYSLLLVFFAGVRQEMDAAVLGAQSGFPLSSVARYSGYITLGYLAPSIIACNLLLYTLFALVGSLAHISHAHREFRAAGAAFMGAAHSILALSWIYNVGSLYWILNIRARDSESLVSLDKPLMQNSYGIADCSTKSQKTLSPFPADYDSWSAEGPLSLDADLEHYYLPSQMHVIESMRSLQQRLKFVALLCPVLWMLGGVLEILMGLRWTRDDTAALNFFTEFSPTNAAIYASEFFPALTCVAALSDQRQLSYTVNEKYVLPSSYENLSSARKTEC